MRRRFATGLAALSLFVLSAGVKADQQPNKPRTQAVLTLQEVIAATDSTHPKLEAAEEKVESAQGKRLAARGAWDPVLSVNSLWSPGYYDNGQVDTVLRQATPAWGIGVYAGYRLGWGDYPEYKGELETLSGGEIRAGIDVPIWKNGPIDSRRAGVRRTRALASAAECERDATQLKLNRDAAKAYWSWVAAGQEVRIQDALLTVAQERDAGLREQAGLGSLPTIVVVDNQRLVLDRQAKLVAAERYFQQAVLKLSLFFRNADQAPVRASQDYVPPTIPSVVLDLPDVETDIDAALQRRPEMCKFQMERKAAQIEARFRRNQRAPSLNAKGYIARDFGAGPEDLGPTEYGVGLSFEMPLALRDARGKFRAAKADVRRMDAEIRGMRDQVGVDVRQARVDLAAAQKQVAVATQQVEVARQLADAEREKFRQGASDLVIVNLREIAAAEAARLDVEARAAHQQARAEYLAAIGRRVE